MSITEPAVPMPLTGIRVLELGRLFAAPFCGQMLADLGADVVKIERPGLGDEFRRYGPPFLKDRAGKQSDLSAAFLSVNRNKRSITIDFATPKGKNLILRLASQADVFIENFKTGVLTRYGLGFEDLKRINQRLVYLSVTGFGQTGPYAERPGTDIVFQAMSGLMSVTGEPDGPPARVGVVIADLIAGLYASIGVLASLRSRDQTAGQGQAIDLSLLDAAIAATSHRAMEYLVSGLTPQREGTRTPGSYPAQNFQCRDGTISVQASSNSRFARFCGVLNLIPLIDDPRYGSRLDRVKNCETLEPIIAAAIGQRSVAELCEALQKADVLAAPVYSINEVFADQHVQARGMKVSTSHPDIGEFPLIANPIRLSRTPIDTYRTPPRLGENTNAVLAEWLGLDTAEMTLLRAEGVV